MASARAGWPAAGFAASKRARKVQLPQPQDRLGAVGGSPAAQSPSSTETLARAACLAVVLLAAGCLAFFNITDPDVFWHVKSGQVILETGRLIHTNLFSFTYPDQPWHNMEWLFQVILAACYNTFGWGGVAGLKLVLVLATTALLTRILLRRASSPLLATTVILFTLALMRFRFTERPHIVTFLLFAVTIWVVERRETAPRTLWLLPPLFALWSNIHPELILSLVYVAATFAGDGIANWRRPLRPAGVLRRELLVLGAATAATVANPEGWRVLLTPLSSVTSGNASVQILEFQRSTLADDPLFFSLLGAVILVVLLRRESRTWSSILPLVALGVIGFLYVRATTAFAMVAAPFVHGACADALHAPDGILRRWLPRVAAVAVAGAALSWTVFLDRTTTYHWGYGPDAEIQPVAAVEFLLAHDVPPNLFNHYNLGGYLIFRLYPKMRVFQDGRGAYPPEFLKSLESHGRETLNELYSRFGVNSALVESALYGLLYTADEWGVVYWDLDFAVLVRRSPANLPFLEKYEYRVVVPGAALPQDRESMLLAVRETRRNQAERLRPDWNLSLSLGVELLWLNDLSGAQTELLRAIELAPREPVAWAYLSVVRSLLGQSAESAAAAARARELDPGRKKIAGIIPG